MKQWILLFFFLYLVQTRPTDDDMILEPDFLDSEADLDQADKNLNPKLAKKTSKYKY